MSADQPETSRKHRVHNCKSDPGSGNRRAKKPSDVADRQLDSGGVTLADMPVDALAKIFRGYCPFSQLQQVAEFGENFGKACGKLLHEAYLQLESDFNEDIANTRQLLADTLPVENNNNDTSILKKTILCKSILNLATLSSTFAHVKATVWSYATAGTCTHYDGQLLDKFRHARTAIMDAVSSDPATKAAADRVVGLCRVSAAASIWNYLLEVDEKTLSDGDRKSVDILGAVSLLDTLVCGKDASVSTPVLTRYPGAETKLVTLTVDISLPYCWMGVHASKEYMKHPAEIRVIDAMHVLRQLVWVSNNEHHLKEWQEALKRMEVPKPKVPKCMSVLLGGGAYRNDGKTGRWFDCVESDGERVFYFGLHSPATYRASTTGTYRHSTEERIRLVDRVVTIPKDFSDAVTDVNVEVTCEENLLPEALCRLAVCEERTLSKGLASSFALRIASYEDGRRVKGRVCEYACYSKGRRWDKRVVIGDHGWRMMQIGDCVDRHRIYETQGKIALKSSPNLYTFK